MWFKTLNNKLINSRYVTYIEMFDDRDDDPVYRYKILAFHQDYDYGLEIAAFQEKFDAYDYIDQLEEKFLVAEKLGAKEIEI